MRLLFQAQKWYFLQQTKRCVCQSSIEHSRERLLGAHSLMKSMITHQLQYRTENGTKRLKRVIVCAGTKGLHDHQYVAESFKKST